MSFTVTLSDLEWINKKNFQRHEAPRRLSATAELLEYIRRVIIFICFCCGNSEADSRRPKVVPQFTFAHNTAFCHWNWWTLTSIVVSDVALDSVCGLNGRERLNWLVIIRTGYFFIVQILLIIHWLSTIAVLTLKPQHQFVSFCRLV